MAPSSSSFKSNSLARFHGSIGRLDLGGSPTELDPGLHAAGFEEAARGGHQFGGDHPALKISHALHGRRFGHSQHPAHPAEALLGVDQVGDGLDHGLLFGDPMAIRKGDWVLVRCDRLLVSPDD